MHVCACVDICGGRGGKGGGKGGGGKGEPLA